MHDNPEMQPQENTDMNLFVYYAECKSDEQYILNLDRVNRAGSSKEEFTVILELCDTKAVLPFKIDTAADCSCINLHTCNEFVKKV